MDICGTEPSVCAGTFTGTELNLVDLRLTGTIPPALGKLSQLRRLALHINALSGTLPPELSGLSQLEYINIYDNKISGTIPSELGALSQLKELGLDHNALSGSVPKELNKLNKLQLSACELGGTNHYACPFPALPTVCIDSDYPPQCSYPPPLPPPLPPVPPPPPSPPNRPCPVCPSGDVGDSGSGDVGGIFGGARRGAPMCPTPDGGGGAETFPLWAVGVILAGAFLVCFWAGYLVAKRKYKTGRVTLRFMRPRIGRRMRI